MDLKERFENFESMPDEAVWKRVQQTLRRRTIARYSAVAAIIVAVAAVAVAVWWPVNDVKENATPLLAKHVEPVQSASPAAPLAEEATSQEVALQPSQRSEKVATQAEPTTYPVVAASEPVSVIQPVAIAHVSAQPVIPSAPVVASIPVAEVAPLDAVSQQAEPMAIENNDETVHEAAATQPEEKLPGTQPYYGVQVWVPNAFSPNDPSGGEVCTFKAVAKERTHIKSFKMYIYNRAGALVYHSTHIDEAWDGSFRGQPCPAGNYVYMIELVDEYEGLQHTRGSVLLIR